jgi:hypothetical protein
MGKIDLIIQIKKDVFNNALCFFRILLIFIFLPLISCKSVSKFFFGTPVSEVMNSWIGDSKQNLVIKWGPPNRLISDHNNGEIYLYSTQKHNQGLYNSHTNEWVGSYYYWEHKMFFVNRDNKIYNWLIRTDKIPPQEYNLNIYFR